MELEITSFLQPYATGKNNQTGPKPESSKIPKNYCETI